MLAVRARRAGRRGGRSAGSTPCRKCLVGAQRPAWYPCRSCRNRPTGPRRPPSAQRNVSRGGGTPSAPPGPSRFGGITLLAVGSGGSAPKSRDSGARVRGPRRIRLAVTWKCPRRPAATATAATAARSRRSPRRRSALRSRRHLGAERRLLHRILQRVDPVASLWPSVPHSLTFDERGLPSGPSIWMVVSKLCAVAVLQRFFGLRAAAALSSPARRRSVRQTAPSSAMIISGVRVPRPMRLPSPPVREPPLNRHAAATAAPAIARSCGPATLERCRIDPAEQGLHAAVPAELQRVRSRASAAIALAIAVPARRGCCAAIAAASPTGPGGRPRRSPDRSSRPAATPTTGRPEAWASMIDTPKVSSAMPET